MTESSYMVAPGDTTDSMAMRRRLALALAQKNMQPLQVDHWAQGLAHLASQGYAGFEMGRIDRDEKDETAKANALMASLFSGGQGGGGVPSAAPVSERPAVDPGSPNARVAATFDAMEPRGIRNNNPLNIEAGGFTQGQPGYSGSDGRFAKFENQDQGIGAADKLLQVYANKHGLNTVEGIVGRWAPAGDGNNVSAYAQNVAKQLQVDPAAPLDMNDPGMRQKLVLAMAQHENGKPIQVAARGGMPTPDTAPTPAPAGQQMAQAAPGSAPPANREAIIQMLGNRKTAPFAQKIISDQIGQQFKPSEYDFKPRDDGSIVAINKKNPRDMQVIQPGNPQDLIKFGADKKAAEVRAEATAKQEVAKAAGRPGEIQQGNVVVQDIDRALGKITEMPGRTTGAIGSMLSGVPSTEAHNVSKLLDTVKANAGFDQLSRMRQASPTGAALGSVTEKEIAFLQSTIGNLEQSQDAKQLADNMRRVKNAYLDVIHGPNAGPPREKLGFLEKKGEAGAPPAGVDAKVWKHMTPEERALWQ
jgi:hypothetical protein